MKITYEFISQSGKCLASIERDTEWNPNVLEFAAEAVSRATDGLRIEVHVVPHPKAALVASYPLDNGSGA